MSETTLIVILYILVVLRLGSHYFPTLIHREETRRSAHELLDSVLVAGVTALLLINFVVRSFYIPSASMEKTLLINDYILVNEFIYHFAKPARGEILVFIPPPAALHGGEKKEFIKRVIGVEGDLIEVRDGWLYRNGLKIVEPYVPGTAEKLANPDGPGPINSDYAPFRVPPGHLFMMGDNRNNSDDSRFWGALPLNQVVGRAFLIFFPFQRTGLIQATSGEPGPSAAGASLPEGDSPDDSVTPIDLTPPDPASTLAPSPTGP